MIRNFNIISTFTLTILALFFSVASQAADPPPPILTSKNLSAQGFMSSIPAGTYLRMNNFNGSFDTWFYEVQVVDANNNLLNNNPLKVSQAYLAQDLSNTINNNLQFIDQSTGKTVIGYPGEKYIITGSNNKGWKTHSVHFIDNEGSPVDHKGIPTNSPREYKITQKYLDSDRMKTPLKSFDKVQKAAKKGNIGESDCPTSTAPTTSRRPEPRPADLVTVPTGESYKYLTNNRSALRAGGNRSCMNKKAKIEKEYLAKHPYGKLTMDQKADRILSDAKAVHRSMTANSGSKNARSRSRYTDFVNGHYVDPLVTPQIASCLAFQETKGTLNPHAMNYTLCNTKMTSTAHGLGQITRTTMKGLRNNPDGDMMPLNTPSSIKYKGMSTREMHSKMSGDTGMQLEVLMRILSSNAKFIRWKNKGLSEAEILRRAVIQYDRDSQSKYLQNVINNCMPCFNNGGDGKKCYKTVK